MQLKSLILSGAIVALSAAPPAFAHHSNAMFDRVKVIELKGTVREFQWTNPHTFIELDTPGSTEPFSIEGPTPGVLRAKGWKFNSLKAGDQVTIKAHPLKDGRRGGGLVQVTKASGEVLNYEPPAPIAVPAR